MCLSFPGRRIGMLAVVACATLPLAARAQFVTDVNGLVQNDFRLFCCFSDVTMTENFPTSAVIDNQFTATSGGPHHANRHDYTFSSDGGATPRLFNTEDSFDISVDVTLAGGSTSPRKEAGIVIEQSIGAHQFIVNTDAQEIVSFGGFQPFFSFNNEFGIAYNAGETINMRLIYNGKTENSPGSFQYIVRKGDVTYSSPVIASDAGEMGIANNSQLLVYAQGAASSLPDHFTATYENFVFGTGVPDLDGDFNGDGTVDAADYVWWRKHDSTPGEYDVWRANFGATLGSSSALGASAGAIPEPVAAALCIIGFAGLLGLTRRRR